MTLCYSTLIVLSLTLLSQTDAKYASPELLTSFYINNFTDTLKPLEQIFDCACPRIYIPVCGTDNKTYTNICYMHCLNIDRKSNESVEIYYMGYCLQFLDPFEY